MNTKHTQGDWHTNDGQIYPTESGKTLALIPYYDKDNEEHEANARLIAAAPELLAALIYIVNCNSEGEDAVLDVKGYNMACNAINKATQP